MRTRNTGLISIVRILQVIHQFPPFSSQGSEVYCANISRQLRASADVRVFHISNPPRRMKRGLYRGDYHGVPTYHCVDGGAYARVADWPNPALRTAFETVLEEMQPDVVHFHNYLSLGDDLVSAAKNVGAAVVYTLHDYGLICPNALLLRDDGTLCDKQHGDFFEHCCPLLIRTAPRRDRTPRRAALPSLTRWQMFGRQQRNPLVRGVLTAGTRAAVQLLGEPRTTDVDGKRRFFLEQTRRIFADTDLFIAPSRFLMDRYVSCGVSADRIVYSRYGMTPITPPPRQPRTGTVNIGYIGALHPQKGVELLLDAFRDVHGEATLHIHGSVFNSPISDSYSRRVLGKGGARVVFHGGYENDRVRDILAGLDVIVVPSLWYENSPLTIQEAFMAGVPVITADTGGMAELVTDGVSGLHFRLGDVASLRGVLQRVVEAPELVERLQAGVPAVTTVAAHTAELLAQYASLTSRAPE
jgi:glycosyltransferase involved in cell wall biosynthesis